jgi:hypothetical protein
VPDLRLELGSADLGHKLIEPICSVYDEVFFVPPFFWRADESRLHRERLQRLLEDPTFGLVIALEVGDLVGFAYGFSLSAATRRWQSVRPHQPD